MCLDKRGHLASWTIESNVQPNIARQNNEENILMHDTIPSFWNTARLSIHDLNQDEIAIALGLYEKSAFMEEWTGQKLDPNYISHCLFEGDLPPNGQRDQFKIQVVCDARDMMIGLLILYHGHPHEACTYITFLFFDPDVQRQGLGRELVQELLHRLKLLGYNEVRANVQLKNWSGLRFWANVGLTTIAGIYGDPDYSNDAYADIELSKQL